MTRLMNRLKREDGVVVAIAIMILSIGLLIGTAALAETLASRANTNRDLRSQRALHAANAGVQAVLYQENELNLNNLDFNNGLLGLNSIAYCIVPKLDVNLKVTGLATAFVNSAGVCPTTDGTGGGGSTFSGMPVGDHGHYAAVMMPGATGSSTGPITLNPKVVAVGWDDNGNASDTSHYRVRKIEAVLGPIAPFQAIEAANDLKITGLLGLTATLNGNARANHNVTVPSVFLNLNLSSTLIGSVTYGNSYSGALSVSHLYHQSNSVNRSAISISPSKPDCSVASNCTALGATNYSSATHKFAISSGTATFNPGDYVFCNFSYTGGTITFNDSASAPVRIFIDSPTSTRCSGNAGSQGNFTTTKALQNPLAGLTGATGASGLQVYAVGNGTNDGTSVTVAGGSLNVVQSLIVYAPTSNVNVTAGCLLVVCAALEGSFIGYDTTINAAVITQDLDLNNYPLYSGLGAFHVQKYVECKAIYPLSLTNPTDGC
jgi:hypothetical protein